MADFFLTKQTTPYRIYDAEFATVGAEWNQNNWEAKKNPAGKHAIYYRTDHTSAKAFLHTAEGTVELLANRVYFVPSFTVIRSEIEGNIQKYFIHFQCDSIEFAFYRQLQIQSVPATPLTRLLFDVILENHKNKTPISEQKICGAMDLLLADFFSSHVIERRESQKFQPVLQYIEEHYKEPIAIPTLAKLMNVTTVYFSNHFKAVFHISPKQYILGKRLWESQLLLQKTTLSVREIAEQVGFENENYFSEFFSERVGISALKFRKYHQ